MPLSADEYHDWALNHVNVFGLGETGDAMLAAWFPIFNGFGYTIAELKTATVALAGDPPRFANEQLRRVNESIAAARADVGRRDRLRRLGVADVPEPGDRGACGLCANAAWVVVPHLRSVIAGQWGDGHATAAVVCGCCFGRRLIEANDNRRAEATGGHVPRPMLFPEYERINPRGRQQLDDYEKAQAAYCREIGPPPGDEGRWARLNDAIDRAYAGVGRRRA